MDTSSSYRSARRFIIFGTVLPLFLTYTRMEASAVPEFPFLAILPFFVIIPLIATLLLRKKSQPEKIYLQAMVITLAVSD